MLSEEINDIVNTIKQRQPWEKQKNSIIEFCMIPVEMTEFCKNQLEHFGIVLDETFCTLEGVEYYIPKYPHNITVSITQKYYDQDLDKCLIWNLMLGSNEVVNMIIMEDTAFTCVPWTL